MYDNGLKHANTATATGFVATDSIMSDVPRVSHEMAVIQKLLAEHEAVMETLEQRLHAVLRPSSQQSGNSEARQPERPITSPLTCDLEGFRLQLCRLTEHQQDIINRLEV